MADSRNARIKDIDPEGIAAELELEPGDYLTRINGVKIIDFIDYLMLTSESQLNVEVLKKSGELWELEIEKEPDEPLGLTFEEIIYDEIRECSNHCLFCFVHQLPKGERSSLYVQDDDYRLSFLQGSYVTLTNLTNADWQRIEQFHLSPLYISVHATDPSLRCKLLGCKAGGEIMPQLKRLAAAGIYLHTQAVLCPGINDGQGLEQTIKDLAELWPQVASLAVVPVGLTEHRQQLYNLRGFDPLEANEVLGIVKRYQQKFLNAFSSRFVFAADEWYIISEQAFPEDQEYEDYLQLDNGVGLVRWFLTEFHDQIKLYLPKLKQIRINLVVLTGMATPRLWQEIKTFFEANCSQVHLDIIPVTNQFFGKVVTVTGLLTGRDLRQAILEHQTKENTVYLIPQITLRQGEAVFLDGVSLTELQKECLPKRIAVVPTRASDWLQWIIEEGSVVGCHVR